MGVPHVRGAQAQASIGGRAAASFGGRRERVFRLAKSGAIRHHGQRSDTCIRVATSVLAGDELDPTGGADQWDSPWSYTANVKTGESAADKAARVAQDREDAGKVLVLVDGVPERHLRFWRSA